MAERPKTIDFPGVVIVGTGLAGVMTALKLAPLPVLLVGAGEGCSHLAQGGVAAAVGAEDSPALHAQDTLQASSGLNVLAAVETVTREGPARIALLENLGVKFDNKGGKMTLGREAAHSVDRILHCDGDASGAGIMRALWEKIEAADHIQVLSPVLAERLSTQDGRVTGVQLAADGHPVLVKALAVVLATGGLGQLFDRTTNPQGVCGSGIGMALRAGATAVDMEFVQFHPTAFDLPHLSPNPLATEALRGKGAILVDGNAHRFMPDIHPLAELAPRDVVARAVFEAVKQTGRVCLDATQAVGEAFPDQFPTVFRLAMEQGIDPRIQPIPVAPAAHYHMGGVAVDGHGRSSLPGLWAVGEVACTGLHGANRLASNSLLEAAVYGPIVAEDIRAVLGPVPVTGGKVDLSAGDAAAPTVPAWLRQMMYTHASLVRDAYGLEKALDMLHYWQPLSEAERNMKLAAQAVLVAAALRRESRGGHYRSDYPATDLAQERRRFLSLDAIRNYRGEEPKAAPLERTLAHV